MEFRSEMAISIRNGNSDPKWQFLIPNGNFWSTLVIFGSKWQFFILSVNFDQKWQFRSKMAISIQNGNF